MKKLSPLTMYLYLGLVSDVQSLDRVKKLVPTTEGELIMFAVSYARNGIKYEINQNGHGVLQTKAKIYFKL